MAGLLPVATSKCFGPILKHKNALLMLPSASVGDALTDVQLQCPRCVFWEWAISHISILFVKYLNYIPEGRGRDQGQGGGREAEAGERKALPEGGAGASGEEEGRGAANGNSASHPRGGNHCLPSVAWCPGPLLLLSNVSKYQPYSHVGPCFPS